MTDGRAVTVVMLYLKEGEQQKAKQLEDLLENARKVWKVKLVISCN
jgi:hypothetical protein